MRLLAKAATFVLAGLILAGCQSTKVSPQLEALASNRAQVLSSELPIQMGPLQIVQARASGAEVTVMMIYDDQVQGAPSAQTMLQGALQSYCQNDDIQQNMALGLSYRIQMRNARGQLVADSPISKLSCQ